MEESQLLSDVERLLGSLAELPEPVARPVFIVVSGLPGTGKSYFSNQLAGRLPLLILESDALRRALFPAPTYSLAESARLFRALHFLIEILLKKGISVILDATNLSEKHREHLYNIAGRLDVKLILVRVIAPPAVVRERLLAREMGLDRATKSEADWQVYEKMRPTAERIGRKHYRVDTSRDITPIIDKIVREARR
ncbi:MAG: ATP-binding protein [Chloroflexi bacterium]|nr:ATP-binding protein [Chloroflexota bacterium]